MSSQAGGVLVGRGEVGLIVKRVLLSQRWIRNRILGRGRDDVTPNYAVVLPCYIKWTSALGVTWIELTVCLLPAAAAFKATFLGNAPCGVYKYKLPKAIRSERSLGVKVFFFKAVLSDRQAPAATGAPFMWLRKSELERYLKPAYMKKVERFVLGRWWPRERTLTKQMTLRVPSVTCLLMFCVNPCLNKCFAPSVCVLSLTLKDKFILKSKIADSQLTRFF